ncbi:hypothetical protein WJ974_17805 [Achromobacter xylosoxidans]
MASVAAAAALVPVAGGVAGATTVTVFAFARVAVAFMMIVALGALVEFLVAVVVAVVVAVMATASGMGVAQLVARAAGKGGQEMEMAHGRPRWCLTCYLRCILRYRS